MKSLIQRLRYAAGAIRQRGLGFVWLYFTQSVLFDLRHGTTTSARVPKEDQDIAQGGEADDGLLYVASLTSVVDDSLEVVRKAWGDKQFRSAQFFDLGCGKGKALLVYALKHHHAESPVAVGIEYDPSLTAAAKENVIACGLSPTKVKAVTDSAVNVAEHVQAPHLIVYLYNSFQGRTLRQVLTALQAWPHYLIYVDPVERHTLDEFQYVVHHSVSGRHNADTWLVASHGVETPGD